MAKTDQGDQSRNHEFGESGQFTYFGFDQYIWEERTAGRIEEHPGRADGKTAHRIKGNPLKE